MRWQVRHFHSRMAVVCLALSTLFCVPKPLRADELTRSVQEELRKRNLYFGDVDGNRTPQLIAALRRYQQRKGFNPSGDTDDTTLSSLSLRAPEPASFSPPAAAANTTAGSRANGTDAAPGTVPLASGAPSETAVSYWPNVTVLRSDKGRSVPPAPLLSNALNNLTPGSADAISPPARFTPVPAASSAATQYPTAADVCSFVVRYLHAGQTNDPDAEMNFYGEQVKYFDEGVVDRQFITQDVRNYDRHWPQRSFAVVGPITVVADANNINHTLAHFHYRFTLKSNRFTSPVSGEVDTLYTLEGSGPDSLRLIGLREVRVSKEGKRLPAEQGRR